ncbi:MAG: hypothetical protein JXX28_19225 [Deltaproteobacteria bacterium]|nr:hypothetical protein [Deltaproteobacteria bacterium]
MSMQAMTLPPLLPWMRNTLGAVLGLYLIEVIARNYLRLPVDLLSWQPLSGPFEPWQLLTHFAVQGPGRGGAWSTLMTLLVLWFFLPAMERLMPIPRLLATLATAAVTGVALGLVLDGLVDFASLYGGATGWSSLIGAMIALFGLSLPNGTVNLWFVLPIKGSWIAWGTLAVSALLLFAEPSLDTAEHLGAVLGVFGWWYLRGPLARRRALRRKSRDIERELRRFTVLPGGRDDETIH